MKKIVALCSFCLLLTSGLAQASAIVDFGTGGAIAAGTILLTGAQAAGSGIPVDALGISGAPTNNGSYDTTGTVSNPGDVHSGNSAELSFNTDPVSNFIRIIGGVPSLGIPDGTTLLSGTFSTVSLFPSAALLSVFGSGLDVKNPLLVSALGLDPATGWNFLGFTIGAQRHGDEFTAVSTDIANAAVPEPASLLLMGTGFLLGGRAFRRLQRRSETT